MKKSAIHSAIGALLAGSMLGGCTHFVVTDNASRSADDDFFFEEKSVAKPAPAPKVVAAEPKMIMEQPAPTMTVAAPVEAEPAIIKTPAPAAAPVPAPAPAPETAHKGSGVMECTPHDRSPYFKKAGVKVEEIKVRATGYGAPPKAFYPEPQRRLMSMRAAKIDAYRSLAERVKGVQIWGGTTIGDMVIEKDRFRVFLDTFLVGAKVMLQTPHEDGTYETVVEMVVGQKFIKTMVDNGMMEQPMDANDPCAHDATPASRMMHTNRPMDADLVPTRARVARSGFYFDRE